MCVFGNQPAIGGVNTGHHRRFIFSKLIIFRQTPAEVIKSIADHARRQHAENQQQGDTQEQKLGKTLHGLRVLNHLSVQ